MAIFRSDSIEKIKTGIKKAFEKIKEEFDEHRETINQNTNEIQANYEYICRLESKIDKLSERIEELTLFFECGNNGKNYQVQNLTTREKEVFMAVYSSDADLTYKGISHKTGLSENLVVCYLSNLVAKGVPVLKRYVNNEIAVSLDPSFKEHQMKHNVLEISEGVSKTVSL